MVDCECCRYRAQGLFGPVEVAQRLPCDAATGSSRRATAYNQRNEVYVEVFRPVPRSRGDLRLMHGCNRARFR